ncbi:YPO3983 family protein [Pantoea agglomerans]|uniref:YPO3983 family protein n=1 Tax=Enterobacter agglomerans TaxID=549 RepID=UPI00177DF6CF|nr:YPO3983 family protein [Pantoea agglomerans]WVL89726.1 YPO3983 family protein [Pantoea agglomerans]
MAALQFPCTLFKTQKWMDYYSASDMQCADLTEAALKSHYGLGYISDRVDPYTLTRRSSMDRPQSMFCCNLRGQGEKITRQQCASMLSDEFRLLSRQFSLYGPYSHLIEKMITHMQNGNGKPFRDMALDGALKEQILNEKSENSTLLRINEVIKNYINWKENTYPIEKKDELRKAISGGKLPKFDRFQDNYNGMGITVHDTWVTHITLNSVHIENDRYRAVVHYKVQDHFGLDSEDILKTKFCQFHFFRIWFVLQRYNQFGFKPFMTNMAATVEVSGGRDEK